jgi:protocatechuate 3,4-dioxygenase beta subunit
MILTALYVVSHQNRALKTSFNLKGNLMHDHDHGLDHDIDIMLSMTASRRQSLRWLFAGAAALPLAACGGGGAAATDTTVGSGDGTNSNVNGVANALILAGVVRSDIRSSFAGATGVAAGVPLTIKLQMVNVNTSCASLAGAAVYLWHCDRAGNYSMYSSGVTGENYLRGVQEADSTGMVTFTTIFPGCYAGRMPHVHFEVFSSLANAGNAANRIRTSQFGFPTAMLADVYASSGYDNSVRNLAGMSYATDNVFSDGTSQQIVAISGSAALGYTATLTVGVAV